MKEEVKDSFNLTLVSFSADSKLKLIKEIKDLMKIGLKEAKEMLENCEKDPLCVAKGISKEQVEELSQKLESLGATIKVD